MGIVNNFEAAGPAGAAFYGTSVSQRHVGGLGDGWTPDNTQESAGSHLRSRHAPPLFAPVSRYIKPPTNAGDPSARMQSDHERVMAEWKWSSEKPH